MKSLCTLLAFGLMATMATGQEPAKGEKAKVMVVGEFTADKDTTLSYTLMLNGKVVGEEKGLAKLPGKAIEVDAASAAGPYQLKLSAEGGVVKVTKIGLSAMAGGKPWEGMFGGRVSDLNSKDPFGRVTASVSFPVMLSPAKEEEPVKKKDKPKDKPKTTDKKKTDKKKPDDKKVDDKKDDGKKIDDKKPDDKKDDGKTKLPLAPPPKAK